MLKLVAMDQDDLQVISAHLQDAVLKVSDLDYLPAERRFLLICNRFVWEDSARQRAGRDQYQRRRSVLEISLASNVQACGISRSNPDDILSLLAVNFLVEDAPAGTIELIFSAGKAIRLSVECIEIRLTDLGPAWETGHRPEHETE